MTKDPASGMFGNPKHLGDAINTTGFETSPVLSPDGKTMFFSSNGLGGSGDADIYQTKRLDETWLNWSAPENMGSRINTTGFDGSFSVDSEGNAYYISGEGNSGLGDLYVISMIQPPPPPPPAPVVDTVPPSVVAAPPVPKRTDTLGQALFGFNSVVINPHSKVSLNNVVTRLKQNASYRIQVEGHTDNKGSEKYNQRLSERRAGAVMKFLVKNGIPQSIIEVRGFGELNPMADNSTDEGQSLNRRVEVKYYIK
jgi:outer membrane protein OmpA-like peptidoglycan-associated protein